MLFHNELTILHTKQRNDVKGCTNTRKRGVRLCFPMYVCNLWGVPITEKFISRRMKPDVYIQLILDNSGITIIFWINSMQLFSLVLLFSCKHTVCIGIAACMWWKQLFPIYLCSYELNHILIQKMKDTNYKFKIENSFISRSSCQFCETLNYDTGYAQVLSS